MQTQLTSLSLQEGTPAPGGDIVTSPSGKVVVDLAAWLAGRVPHAQWRRLVGSSRAPPPQRDALPPRDEHLALKYTARWRERVCIFMCLHLYRTKYLVRKAENSHQGVPLYEDGKVL